MRFDGTSDNSTKWSSTKQPSSGEVFPNLSPPSFPTMLCMKPMKSSALWVTDEGGFYNPLKKYLNVWTPQNPWILNMEYKRSMKRSWPLQMKRNNEACRKQVRWYSLRFVAGIYKVHLNQTNPVGRKTCKLVWHFHQPNPKAVYPPASNSSHVIISWIECGTGPL